MKKYRTILSTILLVLIILGFTLWGGFGFLQSKQARAAKWIASVGDYKIPTSLVKDVILANLTEQLKYGTMTNGEIESSVRSAVSNISRRDIVAEYFISHGLTLSDEYLNKMIKMLFTDSNGVYDESVLVAKLEGSNVTLEEFKSTIARSIIASLVIMNTNKMLKVSHEDLMAKIFYIHNEEERNIMYTIVDYNNYMPTTPSDKELLKVYKDNEDVFTKKRVAKIKYITVDFDSIVKGVRVSSQEVREEEQSRLKTIKNTEVAEIKVSNNRDGKFSEYTDISLTRENADAIFGAKATAKIFNPKSVDKEGKKTLGPFEVAGVKYNFIVKALKPNRSIKLDKGSIKSDLITEKKEEELSTLVNKILEVRADNPDSNIDEIAKKMDKKVIENEITEDPTSSISEQVFALKPDQLSELMVDDEGVFLVQLKSITPEKLIPFKQAKKQVDMLYGSFKGKAKAKELALKIVNNVNNKGSLIQAQFKELKLIQEKTGLIKRYAVDIDIPKELITQAFATDKAGLIQIDEGSWAVFKAIDIKRLNEKSLDAYENKKRLEIIKAIQRDKTFRVALYTYIDKHISKEIPNEIYMQNLARLVSQMQSALNSG